MKKEINLKELRKAIADYIQSEGCSCCEGINHDEHKEILAKILKIPKHKDGSGYNFNKFATRPV